MKLRAWKEFDGQRMIPTPQGPLVAQKGEVVMIVIAETWERAAEVVANLDQRPERE